MVEGERETFVRPLQVVGNTGGAGRGKGSGESAVQNLLAGRGSDPKKEPHSRSEKELPLILLLQAGATVLTNVLI